MSARGVDPGEAASTVADAVQLGFLDDAELAGQLVRGLHGRGYGRRRAAQALRRRGIPAPLATKALEDAYGGVDEAHLASHALWRRKVGCDAERRRAVAFLLRRGFSVSAAWSAVRSARPP